VSASWGPRERQVAKKKPSVGMAHAKGTGCEQTTCKASTLRRCGARRQRRRRVAISSPAKAALADAVRVAFACVAKLLPRIGRQGVAVCRLQFHPFSEVRWSSPCVDITAA
jgi:hypothetical protein